MPRQQKSYWNQLRDSIRYLTKRALEDVKYRHGLSQDDSERQKLKTEEQLVLKNRRNLMDFVTQTQKENT